MKNTQVVVDQMSICKRNSGWHDCNVRKGHTNEGRLKKVQGRHAAPFPSANNAPRKVIQAQRGSIGARMKSGTYLGAGR
jgi:hypothetical protein